MRTDWRGWEARAITRLRLYATTSRGTEMLLLPGPGVLGLKEIAIEAAMRRPLVSERLKLGPIRLAE